MAVDEEEEVRISIPVTYPGALGTLGAADQVQAQTLWDILNGNAYKTLKAQQVELMEQGAKIQAALSTATGSDRDALNQAWDYNTQGKNAWATARDKYNAVMDVVRSYTTLLSSYNPPALSGMGFLPAIPAAVYAALEVAAVATVIYAFYSASANIPKFIDAANNAMATVQTGITKAPDIIEAGTSAFRNVAIVAGVGALAYVGFSYLKKKGHV